MNPAAPPAGTRLCAFDELADPGAKGFTFETGDALFAAFVVRRNGLVFGYVDNCPHADWPLALVQDRYLTRDKDLLICAAHGAVFRIEDGHCVGGPCAGDRLTPWPVAVVDGEVVVA